MPIKPFPHPIMINDTEYSSRFYQQTKEDGIIIAAVTPDISNGEFKPEPAAGGKLSARFNPDGGTRKGRSIPPYIPSNDIKEIVRLAQILKRPVLIKGEPGSGKTQLSRALAWEWYGDKYQQHYFEWFIKSTSKASDGLYYFDHVARLRDAQLASTDPIYGAKMNTDYRTLGPMALAFLTSTEENPSILLIDEIDKADIDFPNDLLLELDERRFKIPDSETGELIEASHAPIIFITSNDERELPEAFLRRCLFLYVNFPNESQMREIIKAHLPGLVRMQERVINNLFTQNKQEKPENFADLITTAIRQFKVLKDEREKDPVDAKRISTSELIDWLTAFDFDLENKTAGIYAQIESYISGIVKTQTSPNEGSSTSTDISKEPLGKLSFYSQAVLKTNAAIKAYRPNTKS